MGLLKGPLDRAVAVFVVTAIIAAGVLQLGRTTPPWSEAPPTPPPFVPTTVPVRAALATDCTGPRRDARATLELIDAPAPDLGTGSLRVEERTEWSVSVDETEWIRHGFVLASSSTPGRDVDAATVSAVGVVTAELAACASAGDLGGILASYTDRGVQTSFTRAMLIGEEPPAGFAAASQPGYQMSIDRIVPQREPFLRGVVLLARWTTDGRIAVLTDEVRHETGAAVSNRFGARPLQLLVFARAGDGWLIDLAIPGRLVTSRADYPGPTECTVTPRPAGELIAAASGAGLGATPSASGTPTALATPAASEALTVVVRPAGQPTYAPANGSRPGPLVDILVDGELWISADAPWEPRSGVGRAPARDEFAGVRTAVRHLTACSNGLDYPRLFSLFTDDAVAAWEGIRTDPNRYLPPTSALIGSVAEGVTVGAAMPSFVGWQAVPVVQQTVGLSDGRVAVLVGGDPAMVHDESLRRGSHVYVFERRGDRWLVDQMIGPL